MSKQCELPIILLGGGGHASVLADILLSQGRCILAVVSPEDIESREVFKNTKRLADDSEVLNYSQDSVLLVNGIGMMPDTDLRRKVANFFSEYGYEFETVVSSDAIVSSYSTIKQGAQVFPGAVVNAGAYIGAHAVVNSGAIVEHDCYIGPHSHLCPGVKLCGQSTVEGGVFVGSGSTVIQGITLSKGVVIAAGVTVVKDVDKYTKVIPNKSKNRLIGYD